MFKNYFWLFILLGSYTIGFAQSPTVKVEIGPDLLITGENLIVKITIQNSSQYEVSDLPEIKGFKKLNRTINHGQIIINKKKIEQHIITENYVSELKGKIQIPSFSIEVNGKNISVDSKTITVQNVENPAEIVNVKEVEKIDFVLESNKSEVYVGEGVKVNLRFYLSDKTTTQWQFPKDISEQIDQIAKKLKPVDCLESRLEIVEIQSKKIFINGESYTYYDLFEAIYYPLNDKKIQFPVTSLTMQKQKNTSFENLELKSKSLIIKTKKLPEHPLKEQVPVGILKITEKLKTNTQYTGNSFDYSFKIVGESDLKTINLEKIKNTQHFEFFQNNPKITQKTGQIDGSKEFGFKIIPKDSGTFVMSNFFYLIYFNTSTSKYDTLKSEKIIKVLGEDLKTNENLKKDIFYDIENLATDKKQFNYKRNAKYLANFLVVIMFLILINILKTKANK